MLTNILVIVVVAIAALLIYAQMRPDTFSVQRSASIKAAPEKIAALIDDFHAWGNWSPYEKRDPDMKRSYSGPAKGKGAVYQWDGNSKVGAGRMEVLETAPAKVDIKLDFIRPFEGHNIATFTMVPAGDSTRVTWNMSGPAAFIPKLMGVFMNMDKMIGTDFEVGLANLKAVAEK